MEDKKVPMHKKAKIEAARALKMMAMQLMQECSADEGEGEMDGLKKVTVAAKDKEGLKEGLEKAEDLLEGSEESEEESELAEAPEAGEDEEASLMAKLEALRAKKAQKA